MPLRLKLFLGVVGFVTVTLSFFGYIAYDTATVAGIKQQGELLRDIHTRLSEELEQDVGRQPNETTLQAWVSRYKSSRITLLVHTAEHQISPKIEGYDIPQELLKRITNGEPVGSATLKRVSYIWHSTSMGSTRYHISVIHRSNVLYASLFLKAMTGTLFFTALIIIWVAIWSAFYIAALLENLNLQKDKLQHQALHDSLTQLPNRLLMQERLQAATHAADRQKTELALMVVDLNRFKEINDTMGHHYGDMVLKEVSKRLRSAVRKSDCVARMGGDEFAIILSQVVDSDVKIIADKLIRLLEPAMEIEGNKLFISGSIGIALYPTQAKDVESLFQHADIAMYAAKGSGLKCLAYNDDMDKFNREKLFITNELRDALDLGQLSVNYQPKIDIKTSVVIGTEALVRWNHPKLGLVPPDQFIPIAEQAGLIRQLTEFVFYTALKDLRHLDQLGYNISMAINLPAINLQDTELESLLLRVTEECGVNHSQVVLEITETAVMEMTTHAMELLHTLDKHEFKISMDDFGTGYSSLVNLRRLPVRELKIDRTFIMGMLTNEEDAAIVRTIIELAHSLGKRVVAEGVETKEVLQTLTDLGSDIAQGYYISRPVTFEALIPWLAEDFKRVAALS